MANDWSERILVSELSDEPALSEELTSLEERVGGAPPGEPPSVVINFANVTYVNSSNLAQLLKLRKMLADSGGLLRISSVTDEVWSVLLVTGLDKVFQFAPDLMTALTGLQIELDPATD